MAAAGERAAVVTVSAATTTVLKNQTESLASVFAASDPDGDTITQYQVSFEGATVGAVTLNGTPIAKNTTVSVGSTLSGLSYTGAETAGTDFVYVRAYDGTQWCAWTQQTIVTPGERAPVVTVSNATPTVLQGRSVALTSLFGVSDPDSDPITQYQVWFSQPGNPALGTVTL